MKTKKKEGQGEAGRGAPVAQGSAPVAAKLPANSNPNTQQNAPFFVDREVIILTRNGVWVADGTEISHEPTRKLFARSLKKDAEGYFLHIGRETKRIQVEDTAYFVVRADGDSARGYELLLNDETSEKLQPRSLGYRPGRLVCTVKGGGEEAKFLHAPYFDILKNLKEDKSEYFLEIEKQRVALARK